MDQRQTSLLDEKMRFFQEMLIQMVNRVEEAILQAQHAFCNFDIIMAKNSNIRNFFIKFPPRVVMTFVYSSCSFLMKQLGELLQYIAVGNCGFEAAENLSCVRDGEFAASIMPR